jgi:hypothetical protein
MGGLWPHIRMQIGRVVERDARSEGPVFSICVTFCNIWLRRVEIGGGGTSEGRRWAQRFRFWRTKPIMLIINGLWSVREVLRPVFWSPSARPSVGILEVSEEAKTEGSRANHGAKQFSVVNERRAVRRCADRPSAEDPYYTTACEDSMAATGIRPCDWRWAFVFSGSCCAGLCDRRFA